MGSVAFPLEISGETPDFSLMTLLFDSQIYSARELEDSMNKIREVLSNDKHDWEQRVAAVSHFTFIMERNACLLNIS